MKTDLYQNELRSLRDGAREFSRKYPALAPHLSGSSTDPDVERILQGTAYLSAGIQERLDTDFPDFCPVYSACCGTGLSERNPGHHHC